MDEYQGESHGEMLLGQSTPVLDHYSPEVLYPIERAQNRKQLNLPSSVAFAGCDQWYLYELSWLDPRGRPEARVGRCIVPAQSPCMVESKSFKLYLNSLNNCTFDDEATFKATVLADLSRVVGADIALELLPPNSPALAGAVLQGICLDDLDPFGASASPDVRVLQVLDEPVVDEVLYSHLLRSLCPVTGQPDWASVRIAYSGLALRRDALLAYLLSFRNHREFHEHCVERMFSDLLSLPGMQHLEVQAFYTRRGGLDISPYRSTAPGAPLPRLNRQ